MEHPFNLKGGGGYVFFMGENVLSTILMEIFFLSLTWDMGRQILWKHFMPYKNIIFVEKNNVATTCPEKKYFNPL